MSKSISTSIKAYSNSIRRIGSNQYAVSTGHNSTPLYKARQTTVPFPSHLDNHYCEEEGNYGPKFTEACEASYINNAIPRKEKDPRSFTLPSFINDFCFDNALVDLEASVSVMPLSTYLNLGLGELAHTRLTVKLADRTVKYPKGIAKNVLVRIGKFTFPIYFIILDMPEDIKVPLILGRPFLSTARAKIDVYKRKITLRVGEEKIVFISVKSASSIIKRVYMLILENMDAYRDEGMSDVIFGEPFLKEADNKAKPQCNKIPPLLKVNEKDVMHRVSHAYQKLKGFYKGVLNLGPDYIRNAKTEEWPTRRHISVHELE
ncbi:hypothetical protein Tco_1437665 [Tanacetum coccineum]